MEQVDGELHIINKELFENIKKTGYTLTENGYTERTEKISVKELSGKAEQIAFRSGYGYFRHSTTVPILPAAKDIPEGFRPYQQEIRRGYEEAERGGVQREGLQHTLSKEQEGVPESKPSTPKRFKQEPHISGFFCFPKHQARNVSVMVTTS